MAALNRVDRWARWSLLGALALAVCGKALDLSGRAPFWSGLLFTFGEAALVGGLADWFAVRALFAHPFGIPFPHTALIPRNRRRIVRQIRELVQNEWLPRSLLTAKVEAFDFVRQGLLPVVEPLKPHLRELLRSIGRDVLDDLSPNYLANFLARGLAGSIDAERVGPLLGDLARRAREQHWLEPLLREWVKRLLEWADSPQSKAIIHRRLQQAAGAYRERGWFKKVTLQVAEALGGVDLEEAAGILQAEVKRFAAEQLAEGSQLETIVREGLGKIEARLRDDPEFLQDLRNFILETSERGSLTVLLEPVLASLREQGRRELESDDSRFLALAMHQLDAWVERLHEDAELREQINAWCRRLAAQLVEQHHSLVGALVEEQLNRLSEENLTELIQNKVGEDLNWIRLNGTFVGGLVGMTLYLGFTLGAWVLRGR
jgi:uncharacterized membrane-anchored protein YjiN (DUF445 family)